MATEDYAETAANAVEMFINNFGSRDASEEFVDKMCCMHRTLQQKFTGEVVLQFIRRMAKMYTDYSYDARNEAACKMCRVMYDAVKETYGFESDESHIRLPVI